jgi:RNA polymerase sigma-70 factor, ECF subfamily
MQQNNVRSASPATVDWDSLLDRLIESRQDEGPLMDDGQVAPLRRWLRFQLAASLGPALRRKLDESDVVQQSMLDVWTAMRSFRGQSVAELQDWLLTVARRNVVDAARRYRKCQSRDVRRERTIDPSAAAYTDWATDKTTASEVLVRAETDAEVEAAMLLLTPLRRDILVARHRDGHTFARIAADRAMTSSAVRNLYRRSLDQMRTILRSHQGDHVIG